MTSDFWTALSSQSPSPSLPASLIDEASVSLFRALLHRCAYPPTHEHSSLAARDALLQFREEARDLYRDVASHRGPAFVGPLLGEAIAKTTQLLHSTDKDGVGCHPLTHVSHAFRQSAAPDGELCSPVESLIRMLLASASVLALLKKTLTPSIVCPSGWRWRASSWLLVHWADPSPLPPTPKLTPP